jgi:hypothetical protein
MFQMNQTVKSDNEMEQHALKNHFLKRAVFLKCKQ